MAVPPVPPHLGLGARAPPPRAPHPHVTPLPVLSSERFLCNRARKLLERAALEIVLYGTRWRALERAHHELEPPAFIARALRLFLFLPALFLSISLCVSTLFLSLCI